jgi:2-hydroxychromene-2-carboxylate isomerase
MGRGEAMADLLFSSVDLSTEGCARHASALGLPLASFRRCTGDPATERRLERDIEAVRRSGMRGLPTVWIGDQVIEGFDARAGARPYAAALERASRARH